MQGYIYILTESTQPELVTILSQDEQPTHNDFTGIKQLRYVAFFKNAHIAYMHVHNNLKRQLNDINQRTYRVSLSQAIAAIEAEDLKQERIWIDSALSEQQLAEIQQHKADFQAQRQSFNRNYLIIGGIGVLLLLFLLLGGTLHV